MIQCPRCGSECEKWDKTKNAKNWLREKNGNWHSCQKRIKKTEDGYIANDWTECIVCKTNFPRHEKHLVEKNTTAVKIHMEIFHKYDGKTTKECFGIG